MQVCCQALAVLPSLRVHWTVAQPQEKDGCLQPRAPGSQKTLSPGLVVVTAIGGLPQPAQCTVFSSTAASHVEYPFCFSETPEGLLEACLSLPRRPRATSLKICIHASLGGAGRRLRVINLGGGEYNLVNLLTQLKDGAGPQWAPLGRATSVEFRFGKFFFQTVAGFSVPSTLS